MSSDPPESVSAAAVPQTTDAVAAEAMSPTAVVEEEKNPAGPPSAGSGRDLPREGFWIDERVQRAANIRPHEHRPGEPTYRPLRIYTRDPAAPKLSGAVATVNVPYEPLAPGPAGGLFVVDPQDGATGAAYRAARLDDPGVLINQGYAPSPADPCFHQQMVYAVASVTHAGFRRALGRHLSWGFATTDGAPARLRLRPHAGRERNAFYDPELGEVSFGYFRADATVSGRNAPHGTVFTCLSHDIIAHEVTHALLDGLRSHFATPSGPDVLAFHEGFADLVAFFQRFSYEKLVETAIRESRGRIAGATSLLGLAEQFANTTGAGSALRTALDESRSGQPPRQYAPGLESHALGSVLVGAVFDAFSTLFQRKTARLLRLATGGTGTLPDAEIHGDLAAALADVASRLAGQFLNICIRAVDYCPPVDLELGEYLRAVITADFDLVPEDPLAYREAWVDGFRRRGIYPRGVPSLTEDALLWRRPERAIPRIAALSFAELKFRGDPGVPAGPEELVRQAEALGQIITRPEFLGAFGLAAANDPRLPSGDVLELPRVQSIRTSRRIGPDRQIVFDLVAEVTQKRLVAPLPGDDPGAPPFSFRGGATVIVSPEGEVRYVIAKNVLSQERCERQRAFMRGPGRGYWTLRDHALQPVRNAFRMLHAPGSDAG